MFLHLTFVSQMPKARSKIAVAFAIPSSGGFPKLARGSSPMQYRQESRRWKKKWQEEERESLSCAASHPEEEIYLYLILQSFLLNAHGKHQIVQDKRGMVSALSCLQFTWESYSALEDSLLLVWVMCLLKLDIKLHYVIFHNINLPWSQQICP